MFYVIIVPIVVVAAAGCNGSVAAVDGLGRTPVGGVGRAPVDGVGCTPVDGVGNCFVGGIRRRHFRHHFRQYYHCLSLQTRSRHMIVHNPHRSWHRSWYRHCFPPCIPCRTFART